MANEGIVGKKNRGRFCTFLNFCLPPHPLAEESAPSHSCQSPSPASQDGEEEKEGVFFPERTIPARNAKVRASKADGKVI